MMRRLSIILSTGLGIGYIPFAPGTFGTLWGVLIYYLIQPRLSILWFIGLIGFILIAIYLSAEAEKGLGEHDSSKIVIDEVVGYLVAVFALPFTTLNLILSFVLFRAFDILKPFPIRRIDQRLPGGWGVVLDDVMAGIFANLVLQLFLFLRRCM